MKKSIGAKSIIYPTPVWIVGSYDAEGKPNGMTVAWGGVCCSKPPSVTVSLRKATYSYESLIKRKAYTVNVPSESQLKWADYFGVASGRDVDKFAASGLTPVKSDLVDAPYIAECPLVLECRVTHTIELGLHTQFVGEIIDVKADESVLNEKGHPDIKKVAPIVYAAGGQSYYGIGDLLGEAYVIRDAGNKKSVE